MQPLSSRRRVRASLTCALAGVVGSLILALFGVLARQITPVGVLFCLVAAFIATTAESYIGATLQGRIPWMTNEVVSRSPSARAHACGRNGSLWVGCARMHPGYALQMWSQDSEETVEGCGDSAEMR